MPAKKTSSATRIMFDRFFRGRSERISSLRQTAREMALGERIRNLRERAGLTQEQLARKIGSSKSAMSRIEDADYDTHSMSTLRKVAHALHQRLLIDFEPLEAGRHEQRATERRSERA